MSRGPAAADAAPLPVLHHDEVCVVVDKPSGLLVHRAPGTADQVFLLQLLRDQIGRFVYPVQRLDRATSGAVAFALSPSAARALQRALTAPSCRKDYLTLVRGAPPARFVAERPLRDDQGRPQACRTEFRTLARFDRCALLRATLRSGRRNQIRRHLNHLGHHVVGDSTYGKGRINRLFRERFALPRLFLHATRLNFDHPDGGARVRLRSPLPAELRAVLARLERLRA